jgi:hypothetical protein
VTNDAVPDFLPANGNGTFEEMALLAGVAVPANGRPVSSMGTDFRDYNNDGWPDIALTALTGDLPALQKRGRQVFPGRDVPAGLGRAPSA